MADNRQEVGAPDRSRVADSQHDEARDFAEQHAITIEQARSLLETYGDDRETLNRAVARIRNN
jgi:hypothetical protein